jgi:DNA-binding beta-propeller fold protein YncE
MRPASRLLLCGVLTLAAAITPAQAQSYHVAKAVTLGGDGGWDYLAFDGTGHRIFIAHQTRVVVVDAENDSVLGEIPGLNGAHGVALATEAGHGFATSGRDSSVTMFDLTTLAVLGRIHAADDADAILYDPATGHVFTFNGDAHTSSVIDAVSGTVVGTVALGGKPEFGVSDGQGRLFVNIEDQATVAEIDAVAMKVLRRWSIAPCESPTGLAIDRAHHRLFSGCRNQVMAISDAGAGTLVTTVPIGQGVDGCAFDAGAQLAFSSNGDGTITVVREDSPTEFRVVDTVATRRGARTMTLDEQTHRLYTATAEFGPTPAPTAERPRPRPSLVPGTFALLVLEP